MSLEQARDYQPGGCGSGSNARAGQEGSRQAMSGSLRSATLYAARIHAKRKSLPNGLREAA